MKMKKELIYKLLWSTIEEYTGLWELQWEINSEENGIFESNKKLGKEILCLFLKSGLIKLYYDKWGNDQLQEIGLEEAVEKLNEDIFWEAPGINDVCIKAGSTEKGEKYYNEKLIDNLFIK